MNCSHFKDGDNIKNTTYYDISYINYFFNSSDFEEYLDLNNSANVSYTNNSYISSHNESFKNMASEKDDDIKRLKNNTFTLNEFYFKKNRNFHVPKVYITLQLFHPYLRPNNTDVNQTRCKYFKIMEMFSAIRREINDKLADAFRANNEIEFGQNENYLFINITCFEDVAYNILQTIKNITIDKNWTLTDFITNNIIYKNEVYDDFLVYDKNSFEKISKYYFYCQLKNNLYNKYEFFPKEFDDYYDSCIEYLEDEVQNGSLSTFIINGYIYGFYNQTQAEKIYELFEIGNISTQFKELINSVNLNDIEPENYVQWVNKINTFNNIYNQANISVKVYNKADNDSINYGIRYISIIQKDKNKDLIDTEIFYNVFQRVLIDYNTSLVDYNIFAYGDIYFELIFRDDNKNKTIPNNDTFEDEWINRIKKCDKDYRKDVDYIGNRFYYIKKNFVLSLFKQQKSLKQRALDELIGFQSQGIILDPGYIMEIYDEYYKNKGYEENELSNLLTPYENLKKINVTLDIFALG